MCRAKPYPRCSSHARKQLDKALASGDRELIKEARVDWFTSPKGIKALEDAGKPEMAEKYRERRARMIARAKKLQGKKPIRLAIDIDNTVGDFTDGLRSAAIKQLGLTPEEAAERFPEPVDYSFVKSGWFPDGAGFLAAFNAAESGGVYRNMTAYPRAIATLRRLEASREVELNFVTARNLRWRKDTAAWLRENRVSFKSLIHTDDKDKTDFDVYLDDAGYQLEKLTAAGKRVIAFDQLYNSELTQYPRVKNWSEVPAMIRRVAKQPVRIPVATTESTASQASLLAS